MTRTALDRSRFRIEPLHSDYLSRFGTFECGVSDLDCFLRDDAYRLHEAHLSFTYLGFVEVEGQLDEEFVGYVSLITDALTLQPEERSGLPTIQFNVLPALKVARLATSVEAKERIRGIGSALMAAAWAKAVRLAETVAIRFLTVDALEHAIDFYERLGFTRNTSKTYLKKKQYTSMRLDLFGADMPSWVFEDRFSQEA